MNQIKCNNKLITMGIESWIIFGKTEKKKLLPNSQARDASSGRGSIRRSFTVDFKRKVVEFVFDAETKEKRFR